MALAPYKLPEGQLKHHEVSFGLKWKFKCAWKDGHEMMFPSELDRIPPCWKNDSTYLPPACTRLPELRESTRKTKIKFDGASLRGGACGKIGQRDSPDWPGVVGTVGSLVWIAKQMQISSRANPLSYLSLEIPTWISMTEDHFVGCRIDPEY